MIIGDSYEFSHIEKNENIPDPILIIQKPDEVKSTLLYFERCIMKKENSIIISFPIWETGMSAVFTKYGHSNLFIRCTLNNGVIYISANQ